MTAVTNETRPSHVRKATARRKTSRPGRPVTGATNDEMPATLRGTLNNLAVGNPVSATDVAAALVQIGEMRATVSRDVALGMLMGATMAHGPDAMTAHAVTEAAFTLGERQRAARISAQARRVVLAAGSGKSGARALGVSTPAAMVAAAAGAKVIKLGTCSASSSVGSRDVADELGILARTKARDVRRDIDETGFSFVSVDPYVTAIDELCGGSFYAPTLFSFGLAALASPVIGDVTFFGLAHPRVEVAAHVLAASGMKEVSVVSTRTPRSMYLDEIGLTGDLLSCQVRKGALQQPRRARLPRTSLQLPLARDAQESLERSRELLTGGGMPAHRVLVARNAAHIIGLSDPSVAPSEAYRLAQDVLRSGLAEPSRFVGEA